MLARRIVTSSSSLISCSNCRRSIASTSSRLYPSSSTTSTPSPRISTAKKPLSSSPWKGKAKASEAWLQQRWSSTKPALDDVGADESTPPMPSSKASQSGFTYAHDDLLSRTPATAGRKSNLASKRSKGYFSATTYSRDKEESSITPPSTSPLVPLENPIPKAHPPTVLSSGLPNPDIRWRVKPINSVAEDWALYKALSKARLSAFTVLTAMAGYAMCPVDPSTTTAAMEAFAQSIASTGVSLDSLSSVPASSALSSSPANSLTLSVLLPMTVGTALCSAAAASFNELIEAPYDAQMARTRARPLPRRQLSPLHVATFGGITGLTGVGTLFAINPLAGSIGLGTILLYCPLYTIAKRHSVYNTWLGAIVGGLPPMIGWAACTSSIALTTQPGAWAMFFLLYAWQFPHFMSLSHTLRSSYASSGYRMLSVLDPPKNALVSLRYSLALLPLCWSFPLLGLTNVWFAGLSTIPNGLMAYAAWKFWRKREEKNAKYLFWTSLVHLPVVLAIALLCKKGFWGSGEEDEEVDDRTLVAKPSGKLV